MSTATSGRRREHNIRDHLTANGYLVIRAAGSKGAVDLVAFKSGTGQWRATLPELLFVQVKPAGAATIPPADRARLLEWATYAGATALVATKGPRGQGYLYRRLTGPGPKEHAPWSPDWAMTS